MNWFKVLVAGLWKENPVFVIVLGMCPTLATTTSVVNGVGMGLATAFVLITSEVFISACRFWTPEKIRIPIYVVIIAAFVSVTDMSMAAWVPDLSKALGIFVPLIVVNCLPVARAEVFCSKNNPWMSLADGISMGIGFTISLGVVASIREILGNGTWGAGKWLRWEWSGIHVMPHNYDPMLSAVLAPGAFITLGFLMAIMRMIKSRRS